MKSLPRGLRNNNQSNEIWKDIPGYEGKYQVSNTGLVKSLPKYHSKSERILKGEVDKDGYIKVVLCPNSKKRHKRFVHRLVAISFIDNPNNLPEVDHINTIKDDNRADNLRWANRSSNQLNPLTSKRLSEKMKGSFGRLNPKSIPIYQCDMNGNIISKWDNAQEYKRAMNLKRVDGIYLCLSGKLKSSGGYTWKIA